MPRDHVSAVLERDFNSVLNSSATRDFHAGDYHRFDAVMFQNGSQFFRVVVIVKFWAADNGYPILHVLSVEVSVGIGGAVGRDEQIGVVKIRCIDRYELDLHRPLIEMCLDGCRL